MMAWYPTVFMAIMSIAQAYTRRHDPFRLLQGVAAIVAGIWYAVVGTMGSWAGWCDGYQLKWGSYDHAYYNVNCENGAYKIEALLVPSLFAFVLFVTGVGALGCMG
jgi:hypothetical protein